MPEKTVVHSDRVVLARMWGYIRSEWALLLGVLFALTLGAIGGALSPAIIGRAVDEFIRGGDQVGLQQMMLLLVLVYLVNYAGWMGQIRFMGVLALLAFFPPRAATFELVHANAIGLCGR